ncbi:hypothetical protein U9M48_008746 [Paspalum notatum var. saurae]|uniref:Uncharacterized protein n=1 Tax=Paspalum notatum var. saurae TaxID=547442 RepID=A0AAQ3SPM8_PASNO
MPPFTLNSPWSLQSHLLNSLSSSRITPRKASRILHISIRWLVTARSATAKVWKDSQSF